MKKIKRLLLVGCCLSVFIFVFMQRLDAGGFQIYQAASAEGIALGAATVARDDLVSSAWYNPAAVMNFKEPHFDSGFSLAKLNWQYEPGNGLGRIKIKDEVQIVPGSHVIYPLNEKYTAAFSIFTPFGLGMKWDDNDMVRLANSGLFNDPAGSPAGFMVTKALPAQTELQVPYLNTTVATRLSDNLSVAGGLSLMKADFKTRFFSQGTLLPATPAWSSFVKYQADGWGLGYVLAAHYKAGPDWKFGVRYLSNADVKMKGTVEDHPEVGNARVKGTLKLPATLSAGFANTGFAGWILSCDIIHTEWSRFDRLLIEPRDAGETRGGFSAPKNWHNTFAYRFGAEYKYSERWTFRGGYVYDNSPISEETRNFELPGTDGHIFSAGATTTAGRYTVDIGYSYMLLEKGRAGTTALNGVGEFTGADNHFLMVSCSRAF